MITTVSPKYQIVIPKAVRRQLKIQPGQKMQVEAAENGEIIVKQLSSMNGYENLARFAGSIKPNDTAWGREGLDAAAWIRRQRDDDWS